MLPRSSSVEGLLPLRLGVWSASSFQLSAFWGGLNFRVLLQGHTLPYSMTEGGKEYKVQLFGAQCGIILTGQPTSRAPVGTAESAKGLVAAYLLPLPSPASFPQMLIPKVLPNQNPTFQTLSQTLLPLEPNL